MKEILLSVCVTAIMTALYKALAPTDKFGAQIKLIVSCFFVVSVINALGDTSGFFDLYDIMTSDNSYNDYSVQLEQLTAEETANRLRDIISETLSKEGIDPKKIYVDINISDKGSISISEIKLVFDEKKFELYSDRAVVLVKKTIGTKIKVTAESSPRIKKEREDQ